MSESKNMETNIRKVQFVIKSSKFCNLRCRYCYEFLELGNKAAITLEQLEQMYKHIASYYLKLAHPVEIEFVWHGGEPLLQPPDYYWQTFEQQQQVFAELRGNVTNTVQTNLTILNKESIQLLKNGFDSVGISIDLFGGLRVNKANIDSQKKVLANMNRLEKENISFSCITVLTKLNLPYVQEIYKFYESRNISFRILPLFNGAFDGQHTGFEIDDNDVLKAFCTLVDLWMESDQLVVVSPIVEYIAQILHYYTPNCEPYFYNKLEWESIYLVNVNGDVYSYADAYNPNFCHGNLFTTSMEEIVLGIGHQKAIAAAEKRIISTCTSCRYFGSCTGYPVAELSISYNQIDKQGKIYCVREKEVLQHIEIRLIQAGIIDPINGSLKNIELGSLSKSLAAIPALASPV
ncbi:radical SAM protein [Nostoc sp. CALU 1950]|uniref:radical SAM protein n=1 Tax=Nostoc sp. CALU 1950 TaxID=3104321 RepID=UPI003EBDDD88